MLSHICAGLDVRGRDLIGMALTGFQTDARSRGDLIGSQR